MNRKPYVVRGVLSADILAPFGIGLDEPSVVGVPLNLLDARLLLALQVPLNKLFEMACSLQEFGRF